jgi:transposase
MLLPSLVTGSVIVMDNAAFHKSAETIEIIEDAGCVPKANFVLFLKD